MKKILLVMLLLIFILCGCSDSNYSLKESVTINEPQDQNVNGYRNEDYINSDKLGWDDIQISDKINTAGLYCGNKKSKKFHLSSCTYIQNTSKENKVYYNTKEQFLNNGYTACKVCNP